MNIRILILMLFLAACSSNKETEKHGKDTIQNSNNSSNWEGTFVGEEVKINGYIVERRLTLKEDSTFELFIETKGISKPNIQRYSGDFKLDIADNTLDLQGLKGDGLHDTFYEIKSDTVLTSFEGRYKLKKAFSNQLTDSIWYLSSVKDIIVGGSNGLKTDNPYLKFGNDGNVSGKTSCNNFNGQFDVGEDGLVTISDLIMTRMACPDSELEKEYLDVLSQKINYRIDADTLTFMDTAGEIIAKFVR